MISLYKFNSYVTKIEDSFVTSTIETGFSAKALHSSYFTNLVTYRSSHRRCFVILKISQENTCAGVLSKNYHKNLAQDLQLYYKKTPTRAFYCEICEIFKNAYFEELLWTTAFELKGTPMQIWKSANIFVFIWK